LDIDKIMKRVLKPNLEGGGVAEFARVEGLWCMAQLLLISLTNTMIILAKTYIFNAITV